MTLRTRLHLARTCARIISMAGRERAVRVKEQLNLVGKLDYPGRDIWMALDSSAEVKRLLSCRKEPETVQWIETHVRPGDVFYDVGANVGPYSLVADAALAGSGKAYAFEPSPSTFAALSANILLNGLQCRVVPIPVALGERTGLQCLRFSSTQPGAARHTWEQNGGPGGNPTPGATQAVLAYRLDDLIRQFGIELPNHVKIDVDGAELSVLRGATQTLAHNCLRSLLIEADEDSGSASEIASLLLGAGFELRSRHRRGSTGKLYNFIFDRVATVC